MKNVCQCNNSPYFLVDSHGRVLMTADVDTLQRLVDALRTQHRSRRWVVESMGSDRHMVMDTRGEPRVVVTMRTKEGAALVCGALNREAP